MSDSINIAIAGLGTVGVGLIKIIQNNAELLQSRTGKNIVIKAVSARSKNKDRGVNLEGITWYEDARDIANDSNVDVVVELIGGDEGVAYDLCKASLENGKHVATANKALIAKHGLQLAEIAEKNNLTLGFEAAVAGGIPVIKSLKEGLAGNNIEQVSGIMNGTCNYILTVMKETGKGFDVVLKDAQDLGYAEADPTFDVDGIDTAHKLSILSSIAFATPVNFGSVYVEGIRKVTYEDINYADELGYKIKLLGICRKNSDKIEQRVHPVLVKKSYPIAGVDDVQNAVYIKAEPVNNVVLEGPGAGEGPTASAVFSDIADIAAGRSSFAFGVSIDNIKQNKVAYAVIDDLNSSYYLRFNVNDESGVLADISDILREDGVSMESIMQKPSEAHGQAQIVGITHKINERIIKKSIEKISQIANVTSEPYAIRVEG